MIGLSFPLRILSEETLYHNEDSIRLHFSAQLAILNAYTKSSPKLQISSKVQNLHFRPPRTRKIGECFAPLWKVPGHLFKRIINRITAICDHPRHESASFNAEQDDAMAPKASHAITCMHTWEIVHWLKKLNYSFSISMSKNHSIFCRDKSFWIFSTLSTSSQCSLMNFNRCFSLLMFRSPSDISHRTSFWW